MMQKPLIHILGIPSGNSGEKSGPAYLREEILSTTAHGYSFKDLGDIKETPYLLHDSLLSDSFLDILATKQAGPFSSLSIAEKTCSDLFATEANIKILTMGGDIFSAYPVMKKWLESKKKNSIKTGTIELNGYPVFLNTTIEFPHSLQAYNTPPLHEYSPSVCLTNHHNHSQKILSLNDSLINSSNIILETLKTFFKETEEIYINLNFNIIDYAYLQTADNNSNNGISPHALCSLIKNISGEHNISSASLTGLTPEVQSQNSSALTPGNSSSLLVARLISDKIINGMIQCP